MKKKKPLFIGEDLDGTLAIQEDPYDPKRIGPPVVKELRYIRKKLKEGATVWILTARVNTMTHTKAEIRAVKRLIEAYCLKWLGQKLFITAEKHPAMDMMRDDRGRQVRFNKGGLVTEHMVSVVKAARRTR